MIAARAVGFPKEPVERLLHDVCREPRARLISFLRETYGIQDLPDVTVPITADGVACPGNEHAVRCLIAAGDPIGAVAAIRDPLGGSCCLPVLCITLPKDWRRHDWIKLLAEIRRRFRHATGRELLIPEPVAHAGVKFQGPNGRYSSGELLVFTGLAGDPDRTAESGGFSFLTSPDDLMTVYRELAAPAIQRLRGMMAFPKDEAASFAVSSRGSRRIRNAARALLRLAPQPHKRWLRARILSLLGEGSSIVDLAGGDDHFMLDIARRRPDCNVFVNDVICGEVERLTAAAARVGVTLLNHDLRCFPPIRFNVAVLKNVMHHLRRAEDVLALLETLPRLADTALIVEIENPLKSALHRFWHDHIYTEDPITDGDAFYTREQLSRVLQAAYGRTTEQISVDCIWTVRGSYMIAEVTFTKGEGNG